MLKIFQLKASQRFLAQIPRKTFIVSHPKFLSDITNYKGQDVPKLNQNATSISSKELNVENDDALKNSQNISKSSELFKTAATSEVWQAHKTETFLKELVVSGISWTEQRRVDQDIIWRRVNNFLLSPHTLSQFRTVSMTLAMIGVKWDDILTSTASPMSQGVFPSVAEASLNDRMKALKISADLHLPIAHPTLNLEPDKVKTYFDSVQTTLHLAKTSNPVKIFMVSCRDRQN